jgi:hypothetical protein
VRTSNPTKKENTNSVELCLSSEVASRPAIQEFLKILRDLKIHYRVHKSSSPVSTLSQINPAHTPHPAYKQKENSE